MPSPASILVYGRDPQLLETRRWVLERAGYRVWTTSTRSDITEATPADGMDLLILCHSLSMEECGRALAIANARWPKVQTLVLLAGQTGCHSGVSSELLDAMEGPIQLLNTVATLVRSPGVIHSQVAQPR